MHKKAKNIEKKIESSFTFVTFKLFFAYHPIEGAQHQKIKTDELGINGLN